MLEFFTSEDGAELYIKSKNGTREFSESEKDLISKVYDKIKTEYPEAFSSLLDYYKKNLNLQYQKFLFVRRFIKCNFSRNDSIADIDSNFDFHFETVYCPLRGECKHENSICKPIRTNKLSPREREVMMLIAENKKDKHIADILYISHHTVGKHRKSILKKLKLNNKADICLYVERNQL